MTRRTTVALLALTMAVSVPAFAQGGGDLKAQISKMSQAWEKAYNAGDAAGVAALYGKDATLMPPGAEPASGSAPSGVLRQGREVGRKNALTTENVTGSGDNAIETGKYVVTSPDGKHLDHG